MTHSNGENVACANYSRGPKPNVSVANPIGLGRGFRRIGGACVLNAKNGSLIGKGNLSGGKRDGEFGCDKFKSSCCFTFV